LVADDRSQPVQQSFETTSGARACDDGGSSQLDHLAGSGLSPDRVVSHRETEELLDDALEQLPLEQKTAFVLAEIQELSLSEIAAVEGVPVGTVKSRISRAKEKLRRVLNGLMSTERLSEK
jgi:RNA polymerase sigma factor (sigma-70 family)